MQQRCNPSRRGPRQDHDQPAEDRPHRRDKGEQAGLDAEAADIKDVLNASAIDVRKKKPPKRKSAKANLLACAWLLNPLAEQSVFSLPGGDLRRIEESMWAWRNW